jgi:hypothetical protein
VIVAYTAHKPPPSESSDQLRARIPGWGVDLDPHDRPSVPRLQFDPDLTGAHWEFPERQPEKSPRERSIEHEFLTPVFGTSCPTRGLSGVVRKYAYRRYSEARAAHWLLLIAADRVDSVESNMRSYLTPRPDNPITETGVLAEFKHHGIRSRIGKRRADVKHHGLDPLIVATPWAVRAALGYTAFRWVRKLARR